MSTQIKRLYQSGKEFVPITLQEAVVVNATNIPGLADLKITTLDKVLRRTLASVEANTGNVEGLQNTLNQAIIDLNALINKKQDKLTAGQGISIDKVGDELVISTNLSFEIYKVVDKLPDTPSASCANTIYFVPTTGVTSQEEKDILEEYMCVQKDGKWTWERLGRIQAGVDLTEYIERIEALEEDVATLKTAVAGSITAQDVTTSADKGSKPIIVTYDIPETLYDSVVATGDGDEISSN